MNKITPFLWFNGNVAEAVDFYTSVFKNAHVVGGHNLGPVGANGKRTIMSATLNIEGQQFIAFDGGPMYNFTPAFSMMINCADQAEVDDLWSKLLDNGGKESRCGWLTDQFGLSWQVIPEALGRLMGDPDPVKAGNVMNAMLKMNKIIVSELEEAYNKA